MITDNGLLYYWQTLRKAELLNDVLRMLWSNIIVEELRWRIFSISIISSLQDSDNASMK